MALAPWRPAPWALRVLLAASVVALPLGETSLDQGAWRASLVETTPLNEWPMLMTHDAATGYLTNRESVIYAWTRTQPASASAFTSQLDCGARAFDLRGKVSKDGRLIFHHGDVEVPKDAKEALEEVVAWANAHPAVEDLVVIYSWACEGCGDQMLSTLSQLGIKVVEDCSVLANLTVAAASELGRLPGGGSVLAITSCVDQNYDETLSCSGSGSSQRRSGQCGVVHDGQGLTKVVPCLMNLQEKVPDNKALDTKEDYYYHCWLTGHDNDFPYNRLVNSLKAVSAAGPQGGRLYELQALWQETTESIAIGVAHLSSILVDESKSDLNSRMAGLIEAGAFEHINFFEVNNVCDSGPDLLAALRQHHLKKALARVQVASHDTALMLV